MKEELKPTRYYKDIFTINYELLNKENIKYLLFDLDNTIARSYDKKPSKEAIDLFKELGNQGFVPIIITNALPWRAKRFGNILNCESLYLSSKPNKRNYLKVINKYGIDASRIAAIGDQIYTDVKGANRLGIKSIFIDRISKRESKFTIPNRIKEKYFIYKKGIIKKGEYYE